LEYFGKLSRYLSPNTRIITSNFDPFLEIALKKNDIEHFTIGYNRDLKYRQTTTSSAGKIIIEYYHGYWLTETAHADLEAMKSNELTFYQMLKEYSSLYVFGFSGWDDAFTNALKSIMQNKTNDFPDFRIHWCFFENESTISKHKKNEIIRLLIATNASLNYCCYYEINTNIIFEEAFKDIRLKKIDKAFDLYKESKYLEINEKSELDISEDINYEYGELKTKKNNGIKPISDFILDEINDGKNIIVCSKFGVGKTTILKNIFKKYAERNTQKHPIFINLAYHELKESFFKNEIVNIIFSEIRGYINNSKNNTEDENNIEIEYLNVIQEYYIDGKKIFLILDGIDESFYKDLSLRDFCKEIFGSKFSIVTSTRLEFHEFIDYILEFSENSYEDNNYVMIEIPKWTTEILDTYLTKLNLNTEKKEIIKSLGTNLNTKPLFVSLLSNLNDKNLFELKDSIADLYYKTISEALDEEISLIYKESVNEELIIIKNEYWKLLRSIANAIYLEFYHYRYEMLNESKPSITFSEKNIRFLVSSNNILNYEQIKKILDSKSQKKIIKQVGKDENKYTFYHRSFLEYLVANDVASKIMIDSKCSEAWDVYQTDEVSDYFIAEIKREVELCSTKKNNIFNAFKCELETVKNKMELYFELIKQNTGETDFHISEEKIKELKEPIMEYSERLEEVLYYVGKFLDYWNINEKKELMKYCHIFYNRIYYYEDGKKYLL